MQTDTRTIDELINSVEDKWQTLFNNFKGFSKNVKSIVLVEKIAGELLLDNSMAAISIKEAIKGNKPCMLVIKTCAEMLSDGWKGLSGNLSKEIKAFYEAS